MFPKYFSHQAVAYKPLRSKLSDVDFSLIHNQMESANRINNNSNSFFGSDNTMSTEVFQRVNQQKFEGKSRLFRYHQHLQQQKMQLLDLISGITIVTSF